MSDLIDRQALKESIEKLYQCDWKVVRDTMFIAQAIDDLPSAEPEERTAKVMKHKYWLGVSLNVVGGHTIGYEWICENCKKKVLNGDDYCSHCGARLEWNEPCKHK